MQPDMPESYQRDGYAVFRQVADADLIAEARAHVEWLQRRNPSNPEMLQMHKMGPDPFWLRLVSDDRLLDIAERFIGPNIALFNSSYFCKAASNGSQVLWHQDHSYWPVGVEATIMTLWLAVDASTQENGCLRVIPGSHFGTLQALKAEPDTPNMLGSGISDALIDESKAVDVELSPGDASVHHPLVIHGSRPNRSGKRRCGIAIRYAATGVKFVEPNGEPFPSAFLLRGREEPGLSQFNAMPRYIAGEHMSFRGCEKWA